jgi:leucyl-tRNA synthetase
MSKSKGNVIDPDDHVKTVGADTVKMYLAFMGPYGETANYPWDMGGIAGIRRFLERVYGLREHVTDSESEETTRSLHKTIAKVREDIPVFKFNTAISAMMIFVNHAEKHGLSLSSYETFLKLLAPFGAHLCEELWEQLGKETSIHLEEYPQYDPELLTDSHMTLSVQFNGKMRGTIEVTADATEEIALSTAKEEEKLQKYFTGDIVRVIYVPGKILNIVLKD